MEEQRCLTRPHSFARSHARSHARTKRVRFPGCGGCATSPNLRRTCQGTLSSEGIKYSVRPSTPRKVINLFQDHIFFNELKPRFSENLEKTNIKLLLFQPSPASQASQASQAKPSQPGQPPTLSTGPCPLLPRDWKYLFSYVLSST